MDLDVKKLDKVIQLCRKRGVKVIKIDNIEITLGDEQPKAVKAKASAPLPIEVSEVEEENSLSEEEDLLFWSTGGSQ